MDTGSFFMKGTMRMKISIEDFSEEQLKKMESVSMDYMKREGFSTPLFSAKSFSYALSLIVVSYLEERIPGLNIQDMAEEITWIWCLLVPSRLTPYFLSNYFMAKAAVIRQIDIKELVAKGVNGKKPENCLSEYMNIFSKILIEPCMDTRRPFTEMEKEMILDSRMSVDSMDGYIKLEESPFKEELLGIFPVLGNPFKFPSKNGIIRYLNSCQVSLLLTLMQEYPKLRETHVDYFNQIFADAWAMSYFSMLTTVSQFLTQELAIRFLNCLKEARGESDGWLPINLVVHFQLIADWYGIEAAFCWLKNYTIDNASCLKMVNKIMNQLRYSTRKPKFEDLCRIIYNPDTKQTVLKLCAEYVEDMDLVCRCENSSLSFSKAQIVEMINFFGKNSQVPREEAFRTLEEHKVKAKDAVRILELKSAGVPDTLLFA